MASNMGEAGDLPLVKAMLLPGPTTKADEERWLVQVPPHENGRKRKWRMEDTDGNSHVVVIPHSARDEFVIHTTRQRRTPSPQEPWPLLPPPRPTQILPAERAPMAPMAPSVLRWLRADADGSDANAFSAAVITGDIARVTELLDSPHRAAFLEQVAGACGVSGGLEMVKLLHSNGARLNKAAVARQAKRLNPPWPQVDIEAMQLL